VENGNKLESHKKHQFQKGSLESACGLFFQRSGSAKAATGIAWKGWKKRRRCRNNKKSN
jgi:hypothetical protein